MAGFIPAIHVLLATSV